MRIKRSGFCAITLDNEEVYYKYLEAVICSIDSNSSLEITRKPQGVNLRLFPSHPRYVNRLVRIVNDMNNQFGLKVDFSKSIKSTSAIQFVIVFN